MATLEPGKEVRLGSDYKPIELMSVCYKILEMLIVNSISDRASEHILIEQVGFRKNRSCCHQVFWLTTNIKFDFQIAKKSQW